MPTSPILARRSIRAYTSAPVSESDLTAILEAAMAAPSAMALDPWRFITIRKRENLDALAEILPYGKMLHQAPLGIIICGDQAKANRGELSYLLQDCSAAIENILLATHLRGLGGVWLGIHPNEDRIAAVRARFAIPESITPISAIAIGHPAETHPPRTRYTESAIHSEQW